MTKATQTFLVPPTRAAPLRYNNLPEIAIIELTRLVAYLTDMARLHLSARPFVRYSVHPSVYSAVFNLANSPAGGVIAKDYNLNGDSEF